MANSKSAQTIRLFKNPVLEYFSHIHPATPPVVFAPVIAYFLYQSFMEHHALITLPLWSLGVLAWTLLEYTMHRFVFHYQPKTAFGKRVIFLSHGVHHDYPQDATRLVMPLLVSVPLAFFFYYLFQFLFPAYYQALYAGLVSGYLAYDCLHFAFHHFSMKGRLASYLRSYHWRHHFEEQDSRYGVSTPLWDLVFGTYPKESLEKDFSQAA